MNACVVYFTKFGHTQKVAEAIAGVLNARTLSADELSADTLSGLDLVVMGSPTHRMNLPEALRPVFDGLPKRVLRGVPVAAFDTSYKMSDFLMRFTAAKKLIHKLRKLGGKRLVPPETFFVMEREGPLYDGEIERARDWANMLLARLSDAG